MKKKQKEQILEILQTLESAHFILKNYILQNDFENVFNLLQECQQTAICVGEFIEQVEAENCNSVHLLEDYCTKLYQIGEGITNNISAQQAYRLLHKSLIAIENSIRSEIPIQIEVLFLPYKASMWDSMESIWQAAQEDSNCNAIVMPIPYFDRTPDGQIKEWHYEGDQYPEYVPTIHYETYNIDEQRPDIIFVHSPYDADNYVTSIHPEYYCKNLKDKTDLLVYVPYFINLDNVPEHFCVCAGTLYAHLVAVQSEKVKKKYIQTFKQFEREQNLWNYFGDTNKKFLALGSPKIDKAVSAANAEFILPNQWEKFLINHNGKRKKIVLLNTTLLYILKYEKRYIDHLKEIFKIFQKYPDIALWWRPHPLSDATFSSMRTELYQEYQELIKDYQTNMIGIYDDSSDLHRAIAMCDACYGDNSSVLALVWAAKKPIMYRNTVKSFYAENTNDGNFMNVVYPEKGGIKKTIFFEKNQYSLENYLHDILDEDRFSDMQHFRDTCFEEVASENFSNFGYAGQKIYAVAKSRMLEKNKSIHG